MAGFTLAGLRTELDLHGLDLETDAEKNALINEAHDELCVQSEWTRANVELGPTVAGQTAYAIPDEIHRPLKLWTDNVPLDPISEAAARRLALYDSHLLESYGAWWISFTAAGVESVSLYPTPSEAGNTLIALSIVHPDDLTLDADVPRVPSHAQRGIIDYCIGINLGSSEDNVERREYHLGEFQRQVDRLKRERLSRTGRGGVHMKVAGYHG